MMPPLLVLALLAQSPLAVDTLRPDGGPEVLWQRFPSPVVALRLSVPLPQDLPPGTAELLQELARPAAERAADRFGAAVELRVAGEEASIAVTGPAAAFDALVGILRVAVAPPDLAVAALRTARARADDRVLAALERPAARLRALLRARLDRSAAGGPATERLDPETIRAIAASLHVPARLRVILVGDIPEEIARSAFARWTVATAGERTAALDRPPPLPPPEAHHAWAAIAYPLPHHPAVVAVAAELVGRRVRAARVLGGAAEAWTERGRGALVVLGGAARNDPAVAGAARITAFPLAEGEDDVSALARFLRRLVAEAAALASPADVADAASSLRRGILLEAATAPGRAAVLGRWSGPRGSRRPSVHDVLARLQHVTLEEVRTALDGALATSPLLVEVRP